MDFDLDADEKALQEAVRTLLAGKCPPELLREHEREPGGIRREIWRSLVEAGVFSLRRPEPEGAGLGMAAAALVYEELGRALVPGPLVATHLAWGLADGEIVGMVEETVSQGIMIEHLDVLDVLLVLRDRGVFAVDPHTVDGERLERPLDPLTPVHRVDHLPSGDRIAGPETVDRWKIEGACLTAALQVGIAAALCEMATAYAKERQQFGRPIGSFQAVKHMCADMLVRSEVARVAVHAAAVTLDSPEVGDVRRAVAAAKMIAGDAAIANGEAAIQVHGGMGFTWEIDAHRYLKRAWVLDTHFGSADVQAEAIASLL